MEIVISPQGTVRFVYSEELDLSGVGALSIRRASHVEPDCKGRWLVDLKPVAGPKIGPFDRRSQALIAEADWLREHWLCAPTGD